MDSDDSCELTEPTLRAPGAREPEARTVRDPFVTEPTMRPGGIDGALARLGQYDVVRKLGGGGFGVVYLARDTESGLDVALKTLHPLMKLNPEEMANLKEKFSLASRLRHANIAAPLTLYRVPEAVYFDGDVERELRVFQGDFMMVMDYAPGVTLSKWRKQFTDGIVPLDQALEVARQLALALDYAHGERVIHRDVKPANVVVETLASPPPRSKDEVRSTKDEGERRDGPQTNQLATDNWPLATSKIRVRILDFGLAAEIRSSMSRISTETGPEGAGGRHEVLLRRQDADHP